MYIGKCEWMQISIHCRYLSNKVWSHWETVHKNTNISILKVVSDLKMMTSPLSDYNLGKVLLQILHYVIEKKRVFIFSLL